MGCRVRDLGCGMFKASPQVWNFLQKQSNLQQFRVSGFSFHPGVPDLGGEGAERKITSEAAGKFLWSAIIQKCEWPLAFWSFVSSLQPSPGDDGTKTDDEEDQGEGESGTALSFWVLGLGFRV